MQLTAKNYTLRLKKHITLTKGKCYWAWNDAKIVKIHGKKYYRVGKNRYVRANKAAKVEITTALDADKLK
ncbi:SLAP domain-containing protein [Lactobacillus helveticus]|uniref:SLAP domain-containing protein n=1 Tax=Lactobacillus helveticus TaxID=1587 RepID=UPI00386D2046